MSLDRRVLHLLLVLGLIGAPAVVLRVLCVGESCRAPAPSRAAVPFCSLPNEVRGQIAAGFREGRSPDFLAVVGKTIVRGGPDGAIPWPSVAGDDAGRVPIVFWGSGVRPGSAIPAGTGLRDVAPTLAELASFRLPHPEVRSGGPVEAVVGRSGSPRLILQVVWKGVGSRDLEAAPDEWPFLRALLRRGAGTLDGELGFLPADPAAALATLGTGGLPREHGITGALVRDGDRVVPAWSPGAPPSVIATLPDDLDETLDQRPRIGLVGTRVADKGAIGGTWYLRNDRDDVAIVPGSATRQVDSASRIIGRGYGTDDTLDVLVVVMRDRIPSLDAALRQLVRAVKTAAGNSLVVTVTATGSAGHGGDSLTAAELRSQVEQALGAGMVDSVAVGGLFMDQAAVATRGTTDDQILRALRDVRTTRGDRVLADAFPGLSVTLSRYC